MRTPYLLALLFFSQISWSEAPEWSTTKQWLDWEKEALSTVKKLAPTSSEKEFLIYVAAGREFFSISARQKSREYYLKAWEHPYKGDKTEVVVQLVGLDLEVPQDLKESVERANRWFKENPKSLTPEISQWLASVTGKASGETKIINNNFYSTWSRDSRIEELINQKKYSEAYELVGPVSVNDNINNKIRADLLSTHRLGKSAPPLLCQSTLNKYAHSITWTMRVCRYLVQYQKSLKKTETVKTIREQIEKESPERISWVGILENLP